MPSKARRFSLSTPCLSLHFRFTGRWCVSLSLRGITLPSCVVGYQTVDAIQRGKFKALAVQFENVAGGEIAVRDLVTVANPAGGVVLNTSSDQIWVWDTTAADWVKYFSRKPRGESTITWCKAGETTETTDTLAAGTTFFFYRGGSATTSLTLAGAVKELAGQEQYTVTRGKFVFMSYPWPVALSIAGFDANQASPSGGLVINTTSDQIWRWNTEKADWDKYFCRKLRGETAVTWCKAGETSETTDSIPAGEGFFFYRGGSATETITFSAPAN